MEITWYGRACFRLKGKRAAVITDPCPPKTGFVAGKHDVDLLTISHDHPDHAYTRSIHAGMTLTRPGEYEFADLLVTGVRTWHDGVEGKERGENVIFSFEVDGVHVCHLGDLGHVLTDEQLHEIGPIDVLLVPAGQQLHPLPARRQKVTDSTRGQGRDAMHFTIDGVHRPHRPQTFLHELAAEPIRLPKASLTPSTLPEETQVVLLEARGRTA